ncbi:MAG: hypothetical protein SFV55_17630 [Haliscomenobacter sp.]|uniref:hypothetical protein n=1 Tax=Haliscomenobacter sp. TaxID=2717303 RepID=UPI0029B6308C|nr:hypothetical protein [Haliscomenobacter sp.]MDX2070253.1 hypothetical protein [Haliscomenobacter sp.]
MVSGKIFEIREELKSNNIEKSIRLLGQLLEYDIRLDEVIIQSARKNHIEKEIRSGTVSFENAHLTNNQIIKSLLEICRDIEDNYNEASAKKTTFGQMEHLLHKFPTGPMVEAYMVRTLIIEACAKSIKPERALSVISEVNAYRKEADPNDTDVTLIETYLLPPVDRVSPLEFWTNVFTEARLHGPRMLAALLLKVPDANFSGDAKYEKKLLLEKIKS